MAGYIAKIERVDAPQRGNNLWVDLLLDKRTGVFYADVGGERVRANSKDEAVKLVKSALAAVTQVQWRQVILLRVCERDRDRETESRENDMPVFGVSCQLTYLRRERAANPLKPKETIEREHQEDFEDRVQKKREHEAYFSHGAKDKKKRADEAEAKLREDRAALAHVGPVWNHFERTTEYEIPYTPESWAGVRKIAEAILDTQDRLDEFVRAATPERLLALATSKSPLLLVSKGGKDE